MSDFATILRHNTTKRLPTLVLDDGCVFCMTRRFVTDIYIYTSRQSSLYSYVKQQHRMTVFEKSVETDVISSLLFVHWYCGCTFYFPRQPSNRLENCTNEYQIS